LGKENAERPIPAERVMRRSVMVIDDEESGAWSDMVNLDSENINQMVLGMIKRSEQLSYIAIAAYRAIDVLILYTVVYDQQSPRSTLTRHLVSAGTKKLGREFPLHLSSLSDTHTRLANIFCPHLHLEAF
jgi:hypothetical protein